jgi:transcriptional regulator with XRE-family HTH domain
MEMKEKRDRVLRDAKALMGLDITTFGTENLPATPLTAYAPTAPKRRGTANVQTIGELLRHFRKEAGLTAKAVYSGLCTQGYYSKIEAGKVKNIDSLLMGELFYRTGRDYRAYFYVFFNEEDFILSNLRYTISMKKLTHDYDAFPPLLEELRRRAVSHSHLYERLIRQNKIARYTRNPEKYTPELKEELEALLRITIPDYNEEHIDRYPLSATEKSLLWMMMNYYLYNKDDARRVAVAKRTLESIEKSYAFDEPLKVLFSKDFRFHYILGMCMLGRVDEVWGEMEIIRKQVATYCITDTLADVAGVYATLLHQAGRAEEALPHFAMGVNFMGLINNVAYESNKKEVEQVYGISLD